MTTQPSLLSFEERQSRRRTMSVIDEWWSLCNEYGDYTMPFEIVHTWLTKWSRTVSCETLISIMVQTYEE